MRRADDRRTRSPLPIVIAIAAITLLAAACSSGTGSEASEEKVATDDSVERVDGVLQPVWILDKVVGIDLDGEEVDISDELLEFVSDDADEPAEFSSQATFASSSNFQPRMLDADDQRLDTVEMLGGVLDIDGGERHVAILATPDADEWLIGKNYTLRFDMPEVDGVTDGVPLVVDYVYVQYLPVEGATGLDDEQEQTPLEMLRKRAQAGAIAYLDDGSGNSQMMTGEVGVARSDDPATSQGWASNGASRFQNDPDDLGQSVSDAANDALIDKITEELANRGEIPADAMPLIEGIRDGARAGLDGKCRSATCIKKLTDKIKEGFKESLKRIDEKLEIDPPDESPEEPTTGSSGGDSGSSGGTSGSSGSSGGGTSGTSSGSSGGTSGTSGTSGGDSGGDTDSDGTTTGGTDGGTDGTTTDGTTTGGTGGGTTGGGGGGGGGAGGGGAGASKTDPHIVTFDGRSYGFQVIGEFIAASSDELDVQVRYEPLACDCLASITTGIAVSDGDTKVQVTLVDRATIQVDGEPVDLDEEGSVEAGDLQIERTGTGVDITDSSDNLVTVNIHKNYLNLFVTRGDDADWHGVFGNANGEPDDDFETRDGESLGTMPREEVIVGAFADSWRISQDESLFEYGADENTKTFTDATYPRPHPEVSESDLENDRQARTKQATAVCEAVGVTDAQVQEDCEFDFKVTGNANFVRGNRLSERFESRARGGGEEVDDEPESGDSGTTLKGSELMEIRGGSLATGDGLVLMRVADDEDRMHLHAFDIETRTERWASEDISGSCRPVILDGVGVVAQLESGSEALGDDPGALVLLSSDDGSELARFTPPEDETIEACDTALVGDGDAVVHRSGKVINGFRIDEEITPLWDISADDADGVAIEKAGGSLVVGSRTGTDYTFDAVDFSSGEVDSSIQLDGGELRSMRVAGEDAVSVVTTDDSEGNLPPTLHLLEVDDGELRTVFTRENGADDPNIPQQLARQNDHLVGWTKHGKGTGLIAYDVSDGETAWTYKTTSFDNQHGLVDATTDVAMVSPFGGAWLELVDSDGEQLEVYDTPGEYGHANQFTVLDDNTVVVSGDSKQGPYIEFVNI